MGELRQLSLFGIMHRPLPSAEDPHDQGQPDPRPASTNQIELFADRACLARDLDGSLRMGDLHEACRLRGLFEDAYGVSPETRALSSLERLADPLAGARPQQAISVWRELDSSLEKHPRLRWLLQLGVFRRLLVCQSAEDLAAASPESLPALALSLASGLTTPPEDGKRQARRLIRDALIAGLCLEPLGFRWDEPVADLLGESDAPPWLACLGVIRRLWPAGGTTTEDIAALSGPMVDPGSSEQAARLFWRCLGASEDRDCSQETRQEARRRMKALRHELHARYMRHVRI